MSSRGPYRRHTAAFKRQLCHDIRAGALGRREAQKKYSLSANLLQLWLAQYDRGELDGEEVEAAAIADYEARLQRWSVRSASSLWSLISSKKCRACAS